MKKRTLSLLLVLALCVGVLPLGVLASAGVEEITESSVPAEEPAAPVTEGASAVASGTCGADGNNLTWTLDSEGTLTISGTGAMADYKSGSPAPWNDMRDSVVEAIIEDGVTSIGDWAFWYCSSMTGVTIPDSVTSMGDSVFSMCSSLESVTIPDGVTSIGDYEFFRCSSMTSVTIPDSVTNIGFSAFSSCSSLTSITIPAGVTSIGSWGFEYCSSLKSVTIPSGITNIGMDTFYCCSSLESVTIPKSVTRIGDGAFDGCRSLKDVYYGGSESDWDEITIGSDNSRLTGADIHYNSVLSDTDPTPTPAPTATPTPTPTPEPTAAITTENGAPASDYVWEFANSSTYFVGSGYYGISNAAYDRLFSSLSDSVAGMIRTYVDEDYQIRHRLYIRDNPDLTKKYRDWSGSCFGMSVWTCLTAADIRSASEIGQSTLSTSDYPKDNLTVAGAINYYHVQQLLPVWQMKMNEFEGYSSTEQISALVSMAAEAENGGTPVVVCFKWYEDITNEDEKPVGHAVVAYGTESVSWTDSIGVRYTGRVLIYDNRDPNTVSYIWYNDSGNWCLENYLGEIEIRSSSTMATRSTADNGCLMIATNDTELMNSIDYSTGTENSLSMRYDAMKYGILSTSQTAFTVTGSDAVYKIDGITTNSDDICVNLICNMTADGTAGDYLASIVMPDPAEAYTVTTEEDGLNFTMQYNNCLLSAVTDESGSVTFSPDAVVTVETDESGAYYVSITADDGYTSLSWPTIEVVGSGASEVTLSLTGDGLLLTADDLTDVTVYGTDNETTAELTCSADGNTVLITEDENGSLVVLDGYTPGDINGDGTVNISDVQLLLKYVNGQSVTVIAEACDCSGDGTVNISDVQLLLKYVNGQSVTIA